jgi:hypothetical protein
MTRSASPIYNNPRCCCHSRTHFKSMGILSLSALFGLWVFEFQQCRSLAHVDVFMVDNARTMTNMVWLDVALKKRRVKELVHSGG